MSARKGFADTRDTLAALRFEVIEAAQILRMSRAQLYNRIHDGSISPQKDGARTYITRAELKRYVESCAAVKSAAPRSEGAGRNRAPAEPA
jgi:excisionase family DNA binding protein